MLRRGTLAALILSFLVSFAAYAEETIKPGTLTRRIDLGAGRSYALYLPSQYSEKQQWPVIYVFDPAARGGMAAERFVPGAEKYGYIVAASNDSRNGPVQAKAIEGMIADVRSRFSIDPRRVYTSGMSGGARIAIMYANRCKECAGVIACAAGYGYEKDFKPDHLSFFAIAGLYDFNFPELYHESEELDRVKATHRFDVFDGDHGWPPPENLTTAMGWLRLQEMGRGITPRDNGFIEAHFKRDAERAARMEAEGDTYHAYLAYKQVALDYASLLDVEKQKKTFEDLASSAAVKSALADEKRRIELQRSMETPVLKVIYGMEKSAGGSDTGVAINETEGLLRSLKSEKDKDRTIALRRALGNIRITALSTVPLAQERRDYGAAVALTQIALATRPDSPELNYNLACAYALQGNKRNAIKALQHAVDIGFRDFGVLKTDPDLANLRGTPDFEKLVTGLSR